MEVNNNLQQQLYSDVSSLSDVQIRLAVVASLLSALFSFFASALTMTSIIKRQLYKSSIYGRVMLAISIGTLLTSLVISLGPLPIPKDLMGNFGAKGNTQTCTAAGFFLLFSIVWTILYSTSLMIHFLLSICYGFRESYIQTRFEKYFHAIPIVITLVEGIVGIIFQFFNPAGFVPTICLIDAYPSSCLYSSSVPCQRGGKQAMMFLGVSIAVPIFLLYVVNNFCLIKVFLKVRERERHNRSQYRGLSTFRYYKVMERQSTLYALAFFFSQFLIVFAMVVKIFADPSQLERLSVYILYVVIVFTYPLLGVWNFIIFISPRYIHIRRRNQEASCFFVLHHALFSERETSSVLIASSSLTFINVRKALNIRRQQSLVALPSELGNNNNVNHNQATDLNNSLTEMDQSNNCPVNCPQKSDEENNEQECPS